MKRIILISLVLSAVVAASGVSIFSPSGSGWTDIFQKGSKTTVVASTKKATIRRSLPAFSKIDKYGSLDVTVERSNTDEVEISGPDNIIGFVQCEVKGNSLRIRLSDKTSFTIKKGCPDLKVRVRMRSSIDEIKSNGSGDVECDKSVDWGNDVKIVSNGSGDMVFGSIVTQEINLSFNGSGGIKINEIKARKAGASLNGSGDMSVKSVDADNFVVSLNGSGDAIIQKTKSSIMALSLNGSGDIVVQNCDCDVVHASLTGTGDINISGKCVHASYTLQGTGDINARQLSSQSVNVRASGTGDINYSKPRK